MRWTELGDTNGERILWSSLHVQDVLLQGQALQQGSTFLSSMCRGGPTLPVR